MQTGKPVGSNHFKHQDSFSKIRRVEFIQNSPKFLFSAMLLCCAKQKALSQKRFVLRFRIWSAYEKVFSTIAKYSSLSVPSPFLLPLLVGGLVRNRAKEASAWTPAGKPAEVVKVDVDLLPSMLWSAKETARPWAIAGTDFVILEDGTNTDKRSSARTPCHCRSYC